MKNETVLTLFRDGRYLECSNFIKNIVKDKSSSSSKPTAFNLQLCSDNNLFVSEQLAQDWEGADIKTVSVNWEKGMARILEIHRSLRYLQLSSSVPEEIALCIIHNTLFWAVMKVDNFCQYSSLLRNILKISLVTLRSATMSLGDFNLRGPCVNIHEEFLFLVQQIIPRLLEVQPDQCYLLINIFILLFILICDKPDDVEKEDLTFVKECAKVLLSLLKAASQIKIHILSFSEAEKSQRSYPKLFKFGFCTEGEVFETQCFQNNLKASFEAACYIESMLYLRLKKCGNSMKCLNAIEAPKFQFLFHYLKALIELEQKNVDACLYQLSRVSFCNSDYFMQARLLTLKGQALLLAKEPSDALKSLEKVQFDHKDVQLPLAAFVTAQAYGETGRLKQQSEILSLLVECLSTPPAVKPVLSSPVAGVERRLLLFAHCQPEITYPEVLYASAAAHLPIQPKEASKQLTELLHFMQFTRDCDIQKSLKRTSTVNSLTELVHDTVCALLQAGRASDAHELCQACLTVHEDRLDFVVGKKIGLRYLKEDGIALMLLAEAQELLDSSEVSNTYTRCAKLMQDFVAQQEKAPSSDENEDLTLAKRLLARVYFQKAQLNIKKGFSDDATSCFKRAVNFNPDDSDVLLGYAAHLLNLRDFDECLIVWTTYSDIRDQPGPKNTTLKYLLGDKMSISEKQDVIAHLQSLIQTEQ